MEKKWKKKNKWIKRKQNLKKEKKRRKRKEINRIKFHVVYQIGPTHRSTSIMNIVQVISRRYVNKAFLIKHRLLLKAPASTRKSKENTIDQIFDSKLWNNALQ